MKEEIHLTHNYLTTLHEKHNEWLVNGKYTIPAPVDIIENSEGDLEKFKKNIRQWATKRLI